MHQFKSKQSPQEQVTAMQFLGHNHEEIKQWFGKNVFEIHHDITHGCFIVEKNTVPKTSEVRTEINFLTCYEPILKVE